MTDPIEDPQSTSEPEIAASHEDSQESPAPTFQPITSQEEFDKTLGKRLAAERAKYSGFDDLKVKASKFDELEAAKKTAEERLTERLQAIESENATLKLDKLRGDVAAAKGLPAKFARRLSGTTREELEADADDMAEDLPKPETKTPLTQKPKESLRGGGRPDEIRDDEIDIDKIIAKIPRR